MKTIWFTLILLSALPWAGFAQSKGAEDCRLLIEARAFSEVEKAALLLRGYKILSQPNLDFSSAFTFHHFPERASFGLEKPGSGFRHYIPYFKNRATTHFIYVDAKSINEVRTCAELKKLQAVYTSNRLSIESALGFFGKKTKMGEAFIQTERVYENIRKTNYGEDRNLRAYNDLLGRIRKELGDQIGKKSFLEVHDQVRRILFQFGMKNYCKSQASLSQFVIERCANCSAQTKLVLSVYHDLGIQAPNGWQLGAEVFADHVRPVLVNFKAKEVLDLVYNKREKNLPNPIMTSEGLLRKTLAKVEQLRPALFIKSDQFHAKNHVAYQYLPDQGTLAKFFERIGITFDNESLPAMDGVRAASLLQSNDATLFDVSSSNLFATGEVPERADLSSALDNSSNGEAQERQAHDLGDSKSESDPFSGEAGEFGKLGLTIDMRTKAYINELSVQYVQPQEKAFYNRMIRDSIYSQNDLLQYSYVPIKGLSLPIEAKAQLLAPIKISIGNEIRFRSTFEDKKSLLVLEVPDQKSFVELEKSTTFEKYKWMFDQFSKEVLDFSNTGLPLMTEFFSSNSPLSFWRDHSSEILRHQRAYLRLIENAAQFHGAFTYGFGTAGRDFIVSLDESYRSKENELAHAQIQFAQFLSKDHRGFLEDLSRESETNLIRFFKFFDGLSKMQLDALDNPVVAEFLTDPGHLSSDRIFSTPLAIILEKMLFDPEYFYTTSLNHMEKRLYGNYFQKKGIIKKSQDVIQPPKVDLGFKCPAQGGKFQKGGFLIECPDQTVAGQGSERELIELPPLILSGLLYASDTSIYLPTWASLIFYSWRDGNTKALELLRNEEKPNVETESVLRIAVAPESSELKMSIPNPTLSPYPGSFNSFKASQGVSNVTDRSEIFWFYVDAILAPNVPVFSDIRAEKETAPVAEYYKILGSNPGAPKWIYWDELYESAYEFYRRFRPMNRQAKLHPVTAVNSTSGNTKYSLPGDSGRQLYAGVAPYSILSKDPFTGFDAYPFKNPKVVALLLNGDEGIFLDLVEANGKFYALPIQVKD